MSLKSTFKHGDSTTAGKVGPAGMREIADKYCTHEQNIYEGSSTGQNQLQWYDKIGGYMKVSTEELSRDKTHFVWTQKTVIDVKR
jgi:hypothetical protein